MPDRDRHQRPETDAKWRSALRRRLIDWFHREGRTLPWRSEPTPYRVWVSEIMCQQTQIATVLPYFERFMDAYPDVRALADAEEQELMRLWEGLGYYRRARSMHQAARQIIERHGGEFPLNFDDVLALPGVGRYTAGAILSISTNQAYPILEGNTQRVFARWIGWSRPVGERESQMRLWAFAEAMVPKRQSSDRHRGPAAFNQAAMELGALICTPKQPACDRCPAATRCVAKREGLQETIPGRVSRVQYETRHEYALVLRDEQGRWLGRIIPAGSRYAGMWELPRVGPPEATDLASAEQWLATQLGGRVTAGARLTTIRHGVTKYRMVVDVHVARWQPPLASQVSDPRSSGELQAEEWSFRHPEELRELPMGVTTRKIVRLQQSERQDLFLI